MLRHGSRGAIFFWAAVLFFNNAHAQLSPELSRALQAQNGLVQQVRLEEEIEQDEFEIKGVGQNTTEVKIDEAQATITITTKLNLLHYQYQGLKYPLKIEKRQVFSLKPPHFLIEGGKDTHYEEKNPTTGDRTEKWTRATLRHQEKRDGQDLFVVDSNGEKTELLLKPVTLEQKLAETLWIQANPSVGELKRYEVDFLGLQKKKLQILKVETIDGKKIYTVSTIRADYNNDGDTLSAEKLYHTHSRIGADGVPIEVRDIDGALVAKTTVQLNIDDLFNVPGETPTQFAYLLSQPTRFKAARRDPAGVLYFDVIAKDRLEETGHQKIINEGKGTMRIEVKKGAYHMEGPVTPQEIELSAVEKLPPAVEKEIAEKTRGLDPYRKMVELARLAQSKVQFCSEDQNTVASLTLEEVLEFGIGVCVQRARILTAFLKAAGIPARSVIGAIIDSTSDDDDPFGGHAWTEFNVDGKWIAVDASSDIDSWDIEKRSFIHSSHFYWRITAQNHTTVLSDMKKQVIDRFGTIELRNVQKDSPPSDGTRKATAHGTDIED